MHAKLPHLFLLRINLLCINLTTLYVEIEKRFSTSFLSFTCPLSMLIETIQLTCFKVKFSIL